MSNVRIFIYNKSKNEDASIKSYDINYFEYNV